MSRFNIGVDLGGTKTEVIVLDEHGVECFRKRVSTVKGSYPDTIKTISSLVLEAESQVQQVCPIGIAIPGAVSLKTNTIKNANSYWLIGQNLRVDLALALNRSEDSIFLENDANCFALSEATDGAGKDGKVVWGLILGTGSGTGVIVNKTIIRGRNLLTGEWGHNPLPWMNKSELDSWQDVKCFCGQKHCAETFISGTGLEREYAKQTGTFSPELKVYSISSKQIIELSRQGDRVAQQCFEIYMSRLGRAIAQYVNFLDPDVIVLGGGMSNIDEMYLKLRDFIMPYIFGGEFDTPIVKAKFGDSSGIRGAAWLPAMYARGEV